MAYAALFSLTQTLDNILLSGDKSPFLDQKPQMKSLKEKLSLFISFLEETSQKDSESFEDLEERIIEAVYECEDIFESKQIILSKSGSRFSKSGSCFWDCARGLLSMCENPIEIRRRAMEPWPYYSEETWEEHNEEYIKRNSEKGFQNVMEKLDSIWGKVEKMKNKDNTEDLQIEDPLTPVKAESTSEIGVDENEEVEKKQFGNSSSSESTPTNTSAPVVGLVDDRIRIKELLAGSPKLEAISIVGMGGIGKTTMARDIYNSPFVNYHFDSRAWITVSRTYDVVALLANLLKSMGVHIDEMNEKDMEEQKYLLKEKLYRSLKQRRYLIIIDDVWDTDFLEEFKNILQDDNTGSRIIITSRSSKVDGSNFFHSSHIHRMNFLSREQSWNLLRQKALGEEPCPHELEEIGWKIVEKCKGLPLALAVIGGVLYTDNKMPEHWKYVEENIKSSKAGNYDDLMEKLSWSYNHLPNHLKACFLYIAVYPEDYVIHVSHLMRLWLAEGFIKPIPPKTIEQVAKEYLEDLISRNMIMVRQWTYYGEIKTCTIHDLLRDLCAKKAREKMFLHIMDNNNREARKNVRRLSFQEGWYKDVHRYCPTVRSLLYFKGAYIAPRNIHSAPLIRVLDACNVRFEKFPTQIMKLVNLRYLAFLWRGGGKIPASISELCNLQTFIVIRSYRRYNESILYLPPEMFTMPWLRHLSVDWSSFSSYPCGALNGNLQLLSGLVDFRFTKNAIAKILDLKTLKIFYRCNAETAWSFYMMENVVDLHQLQNLKFYFTERDVFFDARCQMPPNLSFPQKLNKLTLSGGIISWRQMFMIGLLPNLQVLKLKNVFFENSVWKTNEGEFSELKFLLIGSYTLKVWEAEEIHFPRLECLSLKDCWSLECIPPGFGYIPTLRHIIFSGCSQGVKDSANEILKEQHEFGNESFQLHQEFTGRKCFTRTI